MTRMKPTVYGLKFVTKNIVFLKNSFHYECFKAGILMIPLVDYECLIKENKKVTESEFHLGSMAVRIETYSVINLFISVGLYVFDLCSIVTSFSRVNIRDFIGSFEGHVCCWGSHLV